MTAAAWRCRTRVGVSTVEGMFSELMVAAGLVLAPVAADTYTNEFHGEGSSSFGFALDYARWDAYLQAQADGFTDPFDQCVEIWVDENYFWAEVIWRCTRET
jgi:hypothetical protein